MSELETLLRSWTPRRPSQGVKHRALTDGGASHELVAERPSLGGAGTATLPPAPFRLGWFAPVTVSLLLGCVLFNQHNSFLLSQSGNGGPLVAAALSNQSAAAWLPGSFQRSQNSLPVDAFDWTNGSGFASSLSSSVRFGGTN